MESTARSRYVDQSARKVRLVVDLVRGKPVNEALEVLSLVRRAARTPVEKTIRSAAANAASQEGTVNVDLDDLVIREARVDVGPTLKRFRPRAMGRASRIRKRSCHITIRLSDDKV
jgi:large subunit ribosomal protein L22